MTTYVIIMVLLLVTVASIIWPWVKPNSGTTSVARSRLLGRDITLKTGNGVQQSMDVTNNTVKLSLDQNIDSTAAFSCKSISILSSSAWSPTLSLQEGLTGTPSSLTGIWNRTQFVTQVLFQLAWDSVTVSNQTVTLRIPIPEDLGVASQDLTFHQDLLEAPLLGNARASGFGADVQMGSVDFYADTTAQYQVKLLFSGTSETPSAGQVFVHLFFRNRAS